MLVGPTLHLHLIEVLVDARVRLLKAFEPLLRIVEGDFEGLHDPRETKGG